MNQRVYVSTTLTWLDRGLLSRPPTHLPTHPRSLTHLLTHSLLGLALPSRLFEVQTIGAGWSGAIYPCFAHQTQRRGTVTTRYEQRAITFRETPSHWTPTPTVIDSYPRHSKLGDERPLPLVTRDYHHRVVLTYSLSVCDLKQLFLTCSQAAYAAQEKKNTEDRQTESTFLNCR